MSKAKFTYDESGATSLYFVLSFLALALVPATYYLWPQEPQDDEAKKCRCNGCNSKQQHLDNIHKWKRSRRRITKGIIISGWLIFIFVAYRCATQKIEVIDWDPFEILGVRENASPNEIKKAYRSLSLLYHPDKDGGDPDRFVKITKAYAALTDDDARKNWELYGNPDGPGPIDFGIALPEWIVKKENSVLVLGLYALVFMVALPVSVGIWWYRSVKFGCDKVLISTTELYYYFIHHTPNMALKRVIMIIAASLEFSKFHNPEIVERPTDNNEVPRLMRDLPFLGEENKEKPLCFSYSVKARAIIHAHLSRIKLPPTTLEKDRCLFIAKTPILIQEFVQSVSQLMTLALSGRIRNRPTLMTLENAMKLSSLMVQALWERNSPLLQLPHFTEDTLRHLERKKIRVHSIEQIARMKETERREALKMFNDSQYEDIKFVVSSMPLIKIDCKYEVFDDDDPDIITAGAIVTVTVKLSRRTMKSLMNVAELQNGPQKEQKNQGHQEGMKDRRNHKYYEEHKDKENQEPLKDQGDQIDQNDHEDQDNQKDQNNVENKNNLKDQNNREDHNDHNQKDQEEKVSSQPKIAKKTHPVHCPYFSDDKQEYWWVYIVDKKRFSIVSAPILVTSLIDQEELELKFTAPHQAGTYEYTTMVRSDSYVDAIAQRQNRIDIKPAREYIEPVYDIPDDEEEEELEDSTVEDSDLVTDSDDD